MQNMQSNEIRGNKSVHTKTSNQHIQQLELYAVGPTYKALGIPGVQSSTMNAMLSIDTFHIAKIFLTQPLLVNSNRHRSVGYVSRMWHFHFMELHDNSNRILLILRSMFSFRGHSTCLPTYLSPRITDTDNVNVWFGRSYRVYKENVPQSVGVSRKFQSYFAKQSKRMSSDFSDCGLLDSETVYSCRWTLTFRTNTLIPYLCMKCPWRWKQHGPTKRLCLPTRLRFIILIRSKNQCNFETGQWAKPKNLNNS
jgi:hypothetical protein